MRKACEDAKIQLSVSTKANIAIRQFYKGRDHPGPACLYVCGLRGDRIKSVLSQSGIDSILPQSYKA